MHSYQCEYLFAGVLTTLEVLIIHLLGEVCLLCYKTMCMVFLVPLVIYYWHFPWWFIALSLLYRVYSGYVVAKYILPLQKRICYFDNCISHQNCNCWHGFMRWY